MRCNQGILSTLLLGVVLAAVGPGLVGGQQSDDAPPARVQLIIDYGDGVEKHFTALPWHTGMTVLDALEAAQQHPRGIRFAYRGKAATAFLTRIDDVENEGRGRNWLYEVNQVAATTSFATCALAAGDTVLWKFSDKR